MRKEYKIGLLCYAIAMLMKQIFSFPEFLSGTLLGFSICFMLTAILSEKTYQQLKAYKKKLFSRRYGIIEL